MNIPRTASSGSTGITLSQAGSGDREAPVGDSASGAGGVEERLRGDLTEHGSDLGGGGGGGK